MLEKWVSEKIKEEYKEWQNGDIVYIHAGTGTGKSHFIINELYQHANHEGEKILFISNRDKLKEKNRIDIRGKEDTITLINYQAIEKVILRGENFNFDLFKYVVSDECHYFLTESGFNHNNDLSLKAITELENTINIYMTATGNSFFQFLLNNFGQKRKIWGQDYYIPKDYSRVTNLLFYNNDESLEKYIANEIHKEDKILYFCNNVEKIHNLHNKYKDSMFIFSDPFKEDDFGSLIRKSANKSKNEKYAKYLERDIINEVIEDKELKRKYTFTTTTLDNGIDIFDENLGYIIIDNIRDFDVLIQCIGRKRFLNNNPDDKITVIVKNVNNMEIGGMLKKLKDILDETDFFIEFGVDEWIKKYGRYSNNNYCIYDTPSAEKYGSNKKANLAKYIKLKSDCATLFDILSEDKHVREIEESNGRDGEKIAYIRYVTKLLNKGTYQLIDDSYKRENLSSYLDSIVGKVMLTVKDRKELIEKMNIRHYRKLLKSIDTLNSTLKENGLNFYIKSFQTSKIIEGKKKNFKNAWKVMRLTDK